MRKFLIYKNTTAKGVVILGCIESKTYPATIARGENSRYGREVRVIEVTDRCYVCIGGKPV